MEIWRDIPGYPGYQVSNVGRVRSHNKVTSTPRFPVRRWKDRPIKVRINPSTGYDQITLWRDGEAHTLLIHRLVAEAFLGAAQDGMTVNHINGDKRDNRPENLEWVTLKENVRHAFRMGLCPIPKECVLTDGAERLSFPSLTEASRFLGRSDGYVWWCIKKGVHATGADGRRYSIA